MTPDPYGELRRIAQYSEGLAMPVDHKALSAKLEDIAAHALGWRRGQRELPDLRHRPVVPD